MKQSNTLGQTLVRHSLQSRILVVRVGALGDTLMATPLLRALRRRHSEADLDFLCSASAAPLLMRNVHLSRIFPLRGRNIPLALSPEKLLLGLKLRSRRYDCAILLESAPRYRALLRHGRPGRILSFEEVPFDPSCHAIVNNLRAGGFHDYVDGDLDMDLPLGEAEEKAAADLLEGMAAPIVGVHVGYGPRSKKKGQSLRLRGWRLENFAALIRMLTDKGACVVVTGAAEDRQDAAAVCGNLPESRVRLLAGRTDVMDLAALIRRIDLLVSLDSGPAHMAAALGTPLVVLWGPGNIAQTRPASSFTPIRIVRHQVACAPCYGTPLMNQCRRNICMEGIAPQQVMHEVEELLGAKRA